MLWHRSHKEHVVVVTVPSSLGASDVVVPWHGIAWAAAELACCACSTVVATNALAGAPIASGISVAAQPRTGSKAIASQSRTAQERRDNRYMTRG